MEVKGIKTKLKRVFPFTLIFFFVVFVLFLMASTSILLNQRNIERLNMEAVIAGKSAQIDDTISKLFYRTQTLS